jgi:hypothetical protein
MSSVLWTISACMQTLSHRTGTENGSDRNAKRGIAKKRERRMVERK